MRRFLSNLGHYWWLLWHCFCDERHEGTTEVMFGEGDNGIIGFSLQQIQEMSCALLMQSGKVILCGIGFYKIHSPRGQSVLVHYGWIVALGSLWRWDFLSFNCWRKSSRWNIGSCGWLLHCGTWFLHHKSSSSYWLLVYLRSGDVWMASLLSGYLDLPRIIIYSSYGLRKETPNPSSAYVNEGLWQLSWRLGG